MELSDLELIDEVYSATTAEGSLKNAAHAFVTQQNDLAGAIAHYNPIEQRFTRTELVAHQAELEPLLQELFQAYVNETNLCADPIISADFPGLLTGKLLLSDEVISYESLQRTRYYKNILAPLGVRRTMGWVAAGNAHTWQIFTSGRNSEAGEYCDKQLARARLFQRHFTRAMHTLELLTEANDTRLVFEQAVDRLPQAIIVVDEQLNILFNNATAKNLLRQDRLLSSSGNKFRIGATSHEQSRFSSWWRLLNLTRLNDGAKYNPLNCKTIWEVEASRIASSSNGRPDNQHWMLTLKQNPSRGEKPIPYLTTRYGLSEAEARVCFALCDTGDAISTAESLGITPNTARVHLKHIFKKTGYKNQVELAVNITAETS